MGHYIFDDVNHALIWATEHLRRRSFPKISDIYKQEISCGVLEDKSIQTWSGYRGHLPTDAEESMLLAMQVYRLVRQLKPEEQQLILLRYWGDYHSKKYLQEALQIKEVMRRRGQHVRLNYRFSYRQVAEIENIHAKKAEREIKRILNELERHMSEKELVEPRQNADVSKNQPLKTIKSGWDVEQFSPS
jgi:DNA-directed RNA polymerase specialized sigma24 family protein